MLFAQIQSDMRAALKAGDKTRLETLRFLIAAVKKHEIDAYPPGSVQKLSTDDVVKIVRKQVKMHAESIAAFERAGRNDLVEKETAELAVLKTYLPQEMGDEEIRRIVAEIRATGNADFGEVMGMVMKEVAGRAGGERVARIVREELKM